MRISTGQIFGSQKTLAQMRLADYVQAQRQVASGKRIEELTDDPAGAVRMLSAKSIHRAIEQYDANLRVGRDYLKSSETALSEIHDLMNRAYTLALSGANETSDQAARAAMANEVESIMTQFVRLANSQGATGQYLFAGQDNGTEPYTRTLGTLNYNGDALPIHIEVTAGETMKVNTTGGTLFTNAFTVLEELRTNLLGGNQSALSGVSVANLKTQQEQFRLARGEVGNNLRRIDELAQHNTRRKDDLATQISDIEDVDMVDAITKLQQAEQAYQAALQVSSQTFRLSLLDYLR